MIRITIRFSQINIVFNRDGSKSFYLLITQTVFIRKFKLRLKIYLWMIYNVKPLRNIREKSKKEAKFIPYQRLLKTLDPVLLGDLKRLKIFRKLLNTLNKILKYV